MSIYSEEVYDMYNDEFNRFVEEDESKELQEESQDESQDESKELQEESQDESQDECKELQEERQEMQEVYGSIEVSNFDTFTTPLNQCSAVTISLCLIIFFVMLATIGGVLVD